MARLYEIMREIEDFRFEIDEETGEILNADDLDMLELERDEKIENICLWIKNLRSDAKAYKDEEAAFREKRKKAETRAESLKRYIDRLLDGNKFKTNRVQVSYRDSESVVCSNILAVDSDYLRYGDPELDKTKIKKAIKEGIEVKGCRLQHKRNIQIK